MKRLISVKRYLHLILFSLLSCSSEKKQAAVSLPEFAVSVGYPSKGELEIYHSWVGQIMSMQKAPIIPQVSGYISKRFFKNGQSVKKGDVLYQIQPQLYEQALKQSNQLVAQKEAALVKAQENLSYYSQLVDSGTVSRQTYTNAEQVLKESRAALAAAQAEAQQAKTNLGFCTLVSPMDGIVGFAQAYVGSYVSPESAALVEVTSLSPIRINFAISEKEWLNQGGENGALRVGSSISITLANTESYPLKARIEGVDSRVDTSTGTLMIDAHVDNPDELLRPGMYATVKALVKKEKHALWVPQTAIANVQGANFVLHLPETGAPQMIPVTLGEEQGARISITGKGITENLRLIMSGTQQGLMAAAGECRLNIAPSMPE